MQITYANHGIYGGVLGPRGRAGDGGVTKTSLGGTPRLQGLDTKVCLSATQWQHLVVTHVPSDHIRLLGTPSAGRGHLESRASSLRDPDLCISSLRCS